MFIKSKGLKQGNTYIPNHQHPKLYSLNSKSFTQNHLRSVDQVILITPITSMEKLRHNDQTKTGRQRRRDLGHIAGHPVSVLISRRQWFD